VTKDAFQFIHERNTRNECRIGKEINYSVLLFKFCDKKKKYPPLADTRAQWPEMNSASSKSGARLQWKMNRLSIMVSYYSSPKPRDRGDNQNSHLAWPDGDCLACWLIDWNTIGRNTQVVKTYLVWFVTYKNQIVFWWPKKAKFSAH